MINVKIKPPKIKKDKTTNMYTLTLKAEVKGQNSDFDYDVVVTYRNIKTVREADAVVQAVAETLFSFKQPVA